MATLAVFAALNDGNIRSNDATYLTARSGGTFVVSSSAIVDYVGQELFSAVYYCYESFFEFDTSSLGAGAIISSAVLTTYINQVSGTFTVRARLYDFGSTVTSADWVPGASLSGNTLLAHIASTGITVSAYNNWTDDAFAANVNKTGVTRIVVATDELEAGNAPSGAQYTQIVMANFSGTTFDPYLTVTYTLPAGRSQAVVMV